MKRMHERGCRTLVHIEPYPTPNIIEQDIRPLLEAVRLVNEPYFRDIRGDPVKTIVVVKFGILDNALATLVILFFAFTAGVSWFFWMSVAFTALFFAAFVTLLPRDRPA